ncbi:MAG: deoxyribonuclease IV, partial [Desulfuromonadales bacterium]|nr:deoxyribonuclease IV [Desulfuromonadales bacterium]
EKAFARGEALGCTTMQIFTKNANQWQGKPLEATGVAAFRQAWEGSSIGPVFAHDSYLINLAAAQEELWRKSLAAFADEMQRCASLGVRYLVMHPGAHVGSGPAVGLARVAEALRLLFAEAPAEVTVLLENTAGQGSSLGARFEELAAIMEQVPDGRFGVCFDTCHAFAAGYDLTSGQGFAAVMEEFDQRVGLDRLLAFHLNDSKKGRGCRVDRHEHIGQGSIGSGAFGALMTDPRFRAVPKILETPKGEDDAFDRMNLTVLRQLAQGD